MSIFFAFLISTSASAWNPFSNDEYMDVALSKIELQKVKANAGWAKGEDQTLIFEVSNGLQGPIQCGAANVELKDGKSLGKVFVPKFAIPSQASGQRDHEVLCVDLFLFQEKGLGRLCQSAEIIGVKK
jgi:hypothetical protein